MQVSGVWDEVEFGLETLGECTSATGTDEAILCSCDNTNGFLEWEIGN